MNQQDLQKLKAVAKAEGFPEQHAQDYIAILQGKPYITTGGLQWKLRQQFETSFIKSEFVSPEEFELIRDMLGVDGPLVVMRGIVSVVVNGETHTFEDFGTAHAGNMRGFISMQTYPIEMAARRATNRAMRLATLTGMVSVDELDGAQRDERRPVAGQNRGVRASKDDISAYLTKLDTAYNDGVLDNAEYQAGCAFTQKPCGVLKQVLDKASQRLDERMKIGAESVE